MGIGPVFAVPKLLQRAGIKFSDIDLWELNEAFAVQVVYCRDRLQIDPEKLNVNGGSISIGHPFGMTGSRMVGTLANEMARRKVALWSGHDVRGRRPRCGRRVSSRRTKHEAHDFAASWVNVRWTDIEQL